MIEIRRVGPDGWQHVRQIRLAALRTAPHAFETRYDDEVQLTEADWRARIARGARFVAFAQGQPIGLAVGLPDPGDLAPDERWVVSVFVAPEHRGNRGGGRCRATRRSSRRR